MRDYDPLMKEARLLSKALGFRENSMYWQVTPQIQLIADVLERVRENAKNKKE